MCTLHKGRRTYIRQYYDKFFLERGTFPNKVVDKIKKGTFSLKHFSEHCVVYEIMWENMVHPETKQIII
jgi:hypothetical protein